MAKPDGATELLPRPHMGRTFSTTRRVRLSDTTADGQLRLDALGRYIQDVASDDARETMPDAYLAWVVRRTLIEVTSAPMSEELCELTTWCSGHGGRWAERRTSLIGDLGGRCESVVLWVAIDPATGGPVRLPPEFFDAYDEASGGRKVTARLQHGDPPPGCVVSPWRFRAADVDRLDHVNNAAYWVLAEEFLARAKRPTELRAEIEYRDAVDPADDLTLRTSTDHRTTSQWLTGGTDHTVRASIRLTI